MLCVFVAGLEFLSEVFVSGVEVGVGAEEVGGKEIGNGVVKGERNREKVVGEDQGNGSVGPGKAVAKDVKPGSQ